MCSLKMWFSTCLFVYDIEIFFRFFPWWGWGVDGHHEVVITITKRIIGLVNWLLFPLSFSSWIWKASSAHAINSKVGCCKWCWCHIKCVRWWSCSLWDCYFNSCCCACTSTSSCNYSFGWASSCRASSSWAICTFIS